MVKKEKLRSPFYQVAINLLTPIFWIINFTKYKNNKKLPTKGAYIICANHSSYKDPILLAISQRRQIFFMSKAELFKNRILAYIFRKLGAFPVERGKKDGNALSRAEEILLNGNLLGIFIEGTRSKTGELQAPKSGAVMLAFKTNTPIVPISISVKGGGKLRIFHKVTISYGDPISPKELGLVEGTSREFKNASRIVMDKIRDLRVKEI